MCRWAAYIGAPIYLADVILAPAHSLVAQSSRAREAKTETNGDGFGISWYAHRNTPGLFKDVMPAWADGNLGSLAHHIRSGLFFAHVRASTGTSISRANCHPFTVDNWSFMHNGQVGGYSDFRQQVDAGIHPDLYTHRTGTTDSEAIFLRALGHGLAQDPKRALERAVGEMEALSSATGTRPHMRVSLAVSDGTALYTVRYATDAFAPTLYHKAMGNGRLVVSEPLDNETGEWQAMPPASFATITPEAVTLSPFTPLNTLEGTALAG